MVSREPASVIMVHVREQGVVSREPTSVIVVHVKVARCGEQSAYLCYHGTG